MRAAKSLPARTLSYREIVPPRVYISTIVVFLTFFGQTRVNAAEQPSSEPTNDYEIHWGVQIPTRDGTKLNATAYLPIKKEDHTLLKEPTILHITPYISDTYHAVASYFAQRGYGVFLVDCRGRGNSEGRFEPFTNEANDALDVVEWTANQEFSNGKITMEGGSYSGMNQWFAAARLPPHFGDDRTSRRSSPRL